MVGPREGGKAGGVLALNADRTAGGARRAWMGYIHTPDVDGMIAATEAAGGTVHMPATDLPVGRIAMLSDPQGAVFYIMNPIPPAGMADMASDVFSVTEAQPVSGNELMRNDTDAAIPFSVSAAEPQSDLQSLMRLQ